jgi:hypothetical protein
MERCLGYQQFLREMAPEADIRNATYTRRAYEADIRVMLTGDGRWG